MTPDCGENRRRENRPVTQANPRQNAASWPELIPIVSCLAQTSSPPSRRPALNLWEDSILALLNASIKFRRKRLTRTDCRRPGPVFDETLPPGFHNPTPES